LCKFKHWRDGISENNIYAIPVHEYLTSIQFIMEECLLIHLSQACNDADAAPLYLVDEIRDIIQDKGEDSKIMKYIFESKIHLWNI